jgi:riboflavin synthase
MFTGIIETTGEVLSVGPHRAGNGYRLILRAALSEVPSIGASLALNGACLSVAEISQDRMSFDLLDETLRRTNLGDLQRGTSINLERPLPANGRFDGHIVQGHVDATGTITGIEPVGADYCLIIEYPAEFARYTIAKGSIAINGISLTIAEITDDGLTVWIIPQTWKVTNLSRARVGDRVNLEFDLIAKYVEKLLVHRS